MAEELRRLETERLRKKATDSFINKAMMNMMQLPLNITVDRQGNQKIQLKQIKSAALDTGIRQSRNQLARALYEVASQSGVFDLLQLTALV